MNDPEKILALTKPFSGGDDPLFGTRCTLPLRDFFSEEFSGNMICENDNEITIFYGPGAFLTGLHGLLIYIDIPKNEIQFRARAGTISNLGLSEPSDPKEMYKRFYFIDWPVLNRHKQNILQYIDILVDGQRPENPVWISGNDLRESLHTISCNPFRTRPWFEPGPWGGKWISENIGGLNKNVDNYAWSFELITPENGILLESSETLLEASFDCIMYQCAEAVLGDCSRRFGYDFPIRFDFLDTFEGGNLSIQCHPGPEYTRTNFGENFTQEESYYILDTKDNASVFLGFHDDIDREGFRTALVTSRDNGIPFDAGKFIQSLPSRKHDLFLIPYGTIHGSCRNNLVLEISTTPYIFTFKMYDWLRKDLDGRPRTLNIERAMENLCFERKGAYVREKLISHPVKIDSGAGWSLFSLPTHETHLYGVQRYHFRGEIEIETNNKCLVMNLVGGAAIEIISSSGLRQTFSFAETFIVPAAARQIKVKNLSEEVSILVFAFVK
jgi:mannose-6-phosphate isomerase class I